VSKQKEAYDNQIIHIHDKEQDSYEPSLETGEKMNSTLEGSETISDM
jgi:hypothetical protein